MAFTTNFLEGLDAIGGIFLKAGSKLFQNEALGEAAREASHWGGMGAKGASKVSGVLGGKNLKYTLMGAAALGVASEHPFHGGYDRVVNQGLLGTSHATRTLGMGYMSGAIQGGLGIQGGQSMQTGVDDNGEIPISPYEVPSAPQTSSLQGPDGSIVFGMHALRA